jgi:hypothetical protein
MGSFFRLNCERIKIDFDTKIIWKHIEIINYKKIIEHISFYINPSLTQFRAKLDLECYDSHASDMY